MPALLTKLPLTVYIPTKGRLHKQHTLARLFLQEVVRQKWVHLVAVCPQKEAEEFAKLYPWVPRVLTVPDSYRIGDIIQHIAVVLPGNRKMLIDDDMGLIRRRNRNDVSQKGGTGTVQDSLDLFQRVNDWMDCGYTHGGISLRQGNNHCSDWYRTNTRVCGNIFLDSRVLRKEDIRVNQVQERSDFHLLLSLLERGYSNVCDYEFILGQMGQGTNAPGGCSTYRTPDFLKKEAELLVDLHPTCVKLRYKTRKGEAFKGMTDEQGIPDVTISWLKSFNSQLHLRKNAAEEYPILKECPE